MLWLLYAHGDVVVLVMVAVPVNAASCERLSRPIVLVAQLEVVAVQGSEEWMEIKWWTFFFLKFVSNSESHDTVYFVQLQASLSSLLQVLMNLIAAVSTLSAPTIR